ncbi:pentatricopeptide repeat-containing protein [Tanacetum coccineum]
MLLFFMKKEKDVNRVCSALSSLPPTHTTWDDIISVAVQFRLSKIWDPIILVRPLTAVNCLLIYPRSCDCNYRWTAKSSSDAQRSQKFKRDSLYIDKQGKLTSFNHKKVSRKRGGSLRGQGWKYGSGFVDGIFPVLSPDAQQIFQLQEKEKRCKFSMQCSYSPSSPAHITTWDDIISVLLVQFSLIRKIMGSNAFGAVVYNAYIDGLVKGRNSQKAIEIYQRMKRNCCQPSTDTYTMLINLYGKENNLDGQTDSDDSESFIHGFEGLCEKAEEIFEKLQEAGIEPDVYAYNALMEAYSRAGFPYGAAEIFSLMQHMGCEPDRASFNIMVDAYGRSDARLVFEEMKRLGIEPTMKSHMVLLSAYSKVGNVSKCEEIVSQMHKSGVEPDTFVLNTMLNVYGRMGHFKKMEEVLAVMESRPYVPDISTYNILINMYGRAGYFEQMEEIFRLLPTKNLQKDVVTWTSPSWSLF